MKKYIIATVLVTSSVSSFAVSMKDFLEIDEAIFLDKTSRRVSADGFKTMDMYEFQRKGNVLITTFKGDCKGNSVTIGRQVELQDGEVLSDTKPLGAVIRRNQSRLANIVFTQICK